MSDIILYEGNCSDFISTADMKANNIKRTAMRAVTNPILLFLTSTSDGSSIYGCGLFGKLITSFSSMESWGIPGSQIKLYVDRYHNLRCEMFYQNKENGRICTEQFLWREIRDSVTCKKIVEVTNIYTTKAVNVTEISKYTLSMGSYFINKRV